MLDKIANQKLFFISLIGIVVTSMILTTTFAYQSLRVNYSEGADSELGVSAGVLDVTFTSSDSNLINMTNMPFLDNYKTSDYVEFTIDNSNSSDEVAYQLELTELDYSSTLSSKDFKYSIVDVTDDGYNLIKTGDFSGLSSTEYILSFSSGLYDYLAVGEIKTLRIYFWLHKSDEDQSLLANSSFEGKFVVNSIFASDVVDDTLASRVYNNAKKYSKIAADTGLELMDYSSSDEIYASRTLFSDEPLTVPSSEFNSDNERTLSSTKDSYGISYYYRGNVDDNFINFNGMCWRIVRIQGDGSVKLLLSDGENLCNSESYSQENYTSSFIGYGDYGYYTENDMNYPDYNVGTETSAKYILDSWFNENFESVSDFLLQNEWCLGNEKNKAYSSGNFLEKNVSELLAEKTNFSYYNGYKIRFGKQPSLICEENDTTFNSKVGMLIADELAFSGLIYGNIDDTIHYNNYLADNSVGTFWRVYGLSEGYLNTDTATYNIYVFGYGDYGTIGQTNITYITRYIRPSIVLNSEINIIDGDGTQSNPFVILQDDM